MLQDKERRYHFQRWPTVQQAVHDPEWDPRKVQPVGGRLVSERDALYHMLRQGGLCKLCKVEMDVTGGGKKGAPRNAELGRINPWVHHFGMEGAPGTNNIFGWLCHECSRKC